MNQITHLIIKNKTLIFSSLIFFFTGIFIVLLYPGEGKFRFEFQKGSTWRHDDLRATYNFPIYKSNDVYQHEKDSVVSSFSSYFDYNEEVVKEKILSFRTDYTELTTQMLKIDSFTVGNKIAKIRLYKDSLQKYGQFIEKELNRIYEKGIIENLNPKYSIKGASIFIIRGKTAREKQISEIYTQSEAYSYIKETIASKFPHSQHFPVLDFHNYLKANIFYNKEISAHVLQDEIQQVSLVRGMVHNGEKIINHGDFIDARKYLILLSLKKEYENSSGFLANMPYIYLGEALIILSLLSIIFVFLLFFNPEILRGKRKTLFIMLLPVFFILTASVSTHFRSFDIYLIPLVIVPLTISTFYNIQTAIVIHLLTVFATGYMVPNGFEYSFIQIAAGIGAVLTRRKINHRSHFIKVSTLVFAIYSVIYTGLILTHEGNFVEIRMVKYAVFAINALLLLLTFPLFYFFEKVFGFLSDITLLELSDTNRPLLRMIAEKAPGTFQHSMQVANLAEEAVLQIGGNPLLVRVGAMYHDIGKTEAPAYFVENQHHSKNPHDLLPPEKSAEIIINHIKRGIEIAEENNLPNEIIDFIRTHQGTSKVRWFLNAFKEAHPDVILDEALFKYPGPIPTTRETAVLMMADSIEAASRSLKEFSEENISALVDKIIEYQIKEKQFEQADITFAQINRVKQIFKDKLINIYHTRIEYPKE